MEPRILIEVKSSFKKGGYRIVQQFRDWFYFEEQKLNAMKELVWVKCFKISSSNSDEKDNWLYYFCQHLARKDSEK